MSVVKHAQSDWKQQVGYILKANLGITSEAATGSVLREKLFLEISQNSRENTCAWALQLY